MSKIFFKILLISILIFGIANVAEAKWWIFGQGNNEVNINYLYINKNSFDEAQQKIVLYKETLPNGIAKITGKASVRSGRIGLVQISKDNQATWESAKLSDNGAFQYDFTPEIGKTYDVLIKVIDTTGKTNKIEETHKQIEVSDQNISQLVRETLDGMIKAYEIENPGQFMTYVNPDFAGDAAMLDYAIRKDFNAFDYIKLQYFLNNVVTDASGKTFVSINYIRTVVSTKSGQTYTDRGATELVFKNDQGKPKVLNMKNPLIFGLSDAGNVATGTIASGTNESMLLVDDSGNVDAKPFRDAIIIIENDSDITSSSGGPVESGTFTLSEFEGILFESGIKQVGGTDLYLSDDAGSGRALIPNGRGPAEFSAMGACNLSSVTQAPSGGYINDYIFPIVTGACYAIHTVDNTYALVKVLSYDAAGAGAAAIQYKYQPDGSKNF
ncbi:MAG: hypothetical protein ACD_20C00350G0030 [uncultured bacterium]|nr:MAG: hypothetical protein ACD_20C00350G0030 [uncultured bacterium]HBH18482.1 hypothetical protein [Cyanobacteria bacterium UBA9579]